MLYTPWKPKLSWIRRSKQNKFGGPNWAKIWTQPIDENVKKMNTHETSFHLGQILGAKIASQGPVTEAETPPPLCNVTKVTFWDKCEEIKGERQIKPRPLNYELWTWTCENLRKVTNIPHDQNPKSVTFVMFSDKQQTGSVFWQLEDIIYTPRQKFHPLK